MLLSEKYGLVWENGNTDETIVLLSPKTPDTHITAKVEFGDCEGRISFEKLQSDRNSISLNKGLHIK